MNKLGIIKNIATSLMVTTIVVVPTVVHFTTPEIPKPDPAFTTYTKQTLEEFGGSNFYSYSGDIEGISARPRESGDFSSIVPYLESRVTNILGPNLDGEIQKITGQLESGEQECDVMFDIKASNGCEQWKPIILQGHMDMVLDGALADKEEAKVHGIKPVIEGHKIHSLDYKTSLGADNGMGIAITLTLLRNINNFKHGPIRVIYTSNEETTTGGAVIVKDSAELTQKVFYKDGKRIDHLINVDAEPRFGIYRSCAGLFDIHFDHNYTPVEINDGWKTYELWVGNLNGGHSAWDMENKRANADRMTFEFLYKLNGPSGQNIQIISYDHNGSEPKSNQIIKNGHLIFAINSENITENDMRSTRNNLIDLWSDFYTGDNFDSVQFSYSEIPSSAKCLSAIDSANLIKFLGSNTKASMDPQDLEKGLYYGIYEMTEDDSPRPVASTNIGPVKIESDKNNVYLTGVSKTRLIDEASIDPMSNAYIAAGQSILQYAIIRNNIMIPWMPIENNVVLDWMEQAYRKIGIEPNPIDTRGGVEPAYWILCNPDLKCICVGPEILNAHSTSEVCSLETIDPCFRALVDVLGRMNEA